MTSKLALHNHDCQKCQGQPSSEKNLRLTLIAQIIFIAFLLTGASFARSQIVWAETLHTVVDGVAVLIAWLGAIFSRLRPDKKRTFGYQRISLFASLIISILVLFGGVEIIIDSLTNLFSPAHEILEATPTILIAILGLIYSLFFGSRLHRGHSHNEKSLSLHLFLDASNWLIALLGVLLISFFNWWWLDSLLALGLITFIVFLTLKNLRQTLNIFLQGVPDNIDLDHLAASLAQIKNVKKITELHVWSLDGEEDVATIKVIPQSQNTAQLRTDLRQELKKHGINQSVIEIED